MSRLNTGGASVLRILREFYCWSKTSTALYLQLLEYAVFVLSYWVMHMHRLYLSTAQTFILLYTDLVCFKRCSVFSVVKIIQIIFINYDTMVQFTQFTFSNIFEIRLICWNNCFRMLNVDNYTNINCMTAISAFKV